LIKTVHLGRFEYSAKTRGRTFLSWVFVRLLDATVLSTYPGIWQERKGKGTADPIFRRPKW